MARELISSFDTWRYENKMQERNMAHFLMKTIEAFPMGLQTSNHFNNLREPLSWLLQM